MHALLPMRRSVARPSPQGCTAAQPVAIAKTIDGRCRLRVGALLVALSVTLGACAANADASVAASVRAHLQAAATAAFSGATRVEVTLRAGAGAELPMCPMPLTIDTQKQHLRGYVGVTVGCPAPPVWTVHLAAQINVFFPVVVSRAAIARGSRVTAADVAIAERELSGAGGANFDRVEQVVGQQTRAAIAAGQLIAPWHLDRPHLINRGESVALHAGTGEFEVTTHAQALDNGRLGDQIRVRNATSGRIVYGWVDSPGSVSTRPPAG